MDLNIWLAYLLTEFLLQITPGPAVMLVSTQGLKYGAKPSFFGALGISGGNFVYFILSALGLGAFILAAGPWFTFLKIIGAFYLIFTGLLMIYRSFKASIKHNAQVQLSQNHRKSFTQGFITQMANPKAILFFMALIPQFINPNQNTTFQFFILGITTILMETFILMSYGWLSANAKKRMGENQTFVKWQDRMAGLFLLGLGVRLFFDQKLTILFSALKML